MADYGCYPLWVYDESGEFDNPDPAKLPLSVETVARLKRWSQSYDASLNRKDPASSGFANQEEDEAFEQEGISLWRKLREELGHEYDVEYFSERLNSVVSNERELLSYT